LKTFLLNNLILAYNVLYKATIILYNFRVGHSVEMCENYTNRKDLESL